MAAKQLPKVTHEESLLKRLHFVAVVLFVIIAFKYIASDLIAPVLLAAMFAVILLPIYSFYRKKGIPANFSIFFMIVTILLATFGLILILNFSFGLLRETLMTAIDSISSFRSDSSFWGSLNTQAAQATQNIVSPEILLRLLNTLFANLSGLFLYFIIIPVLAILLVAQIDSFSAGFKTELGKRGPSLDQYRNFARSINNYIIARFKVNITTSLMLTPILLLLGVDYAILWGLLPIVLCFIPYIGIYIAMAGPMLIMFATNGIPGVITLVIVYTIVTALNENIIDPLVQGKQSRLTTASLIIGFIFWSWLFGVFGAIISAPLTVMSKTILEQYPETKWIAMLMTGDYSDSKKSKHLFSKALIRLKRRLLISAK